MFKIFLISITVVVMVAQENENPCNEGDSTDNNNGFNVNSNSANYQQQQGFRGFNGGNELSSNGFRRSADTPIGFGINFPSQRFPAGQIGSNFPQQASQFGNRFGGQQFGQNGFGFGYRNNQLERNQFPNTDFGSNAQNFGTFQQRRQL